MEVLAKIVFSIVAIAIAGIPTWIYLLIRLCLEPSGFWQEIVVFGFGVWILGGLQFFLFIILLVVIFGAIWGD
jgi:hypothetical protein